MIAFDADFQEDLKENLCSLIFFSIFSIGNCLPMIPVENNNTWDDLQSSF